MIEDELNEILPYIEKNECALFIGAGVSALAGCYTWDSFTQKLLEHDIIRSIIKKEDIKRFSNEEIIEFCKQTLCKNGYENDFWGIARLIITPDPSKFEQKYLPLVKEIKKIKPFPHIIITTNIDNCLEQTKIVKLNRIFYELNDFIIDNINKNETSVFHIHGYIENFRKSLLTRSMYLQRYKDSKFKEFLGYIFSNYSVLFLGYSLRDQEIKDIILENKDERKKHFALFPDDESYQPEIFLDMYNIKVITYGRKEEFSEKLINWIRKNFEEVQK